MMMKACLLMRCLWLLLIAMGASTVSAQGPKSPGLGYVFPPVIKAGQTTSVILGGFDFTPDMQWFVHDERVQIQVDGPPGDYLLPPPPYWTGPRAGTSAPAIPREVPARITVASDTPEGLVHWQVANANGASDTSVFYVSQGREILESRSRDIAQDVEALPLGISGRLSRLTEVDKYRFVADRDGLVTADLMARRLGSDFNGAIKVHDSSGQILADFADTQGLDGGVTFGVAAGNAYTVSIHDTDFRGDRAYVYRLSLNYGSPVLATSPACGQRGTASNLKLMGVGLQSALAELDSLETTVTFPSDEGQPLQIVSTQTPNQVVDVAVPLSSHSEIVSADEPETQSIVPPVGVTGFFADEVREKRFQWTSVKDERWSINVQSRALGSRMDVSLEVLGPDGQRIADNDDTDGSTDSALEFQTTADGVHTAVVRGVPANYSGIVAYGNSLDQFRLTVQKAEADFDLVVPQKLTIGLGDKAELPVQIIRRAGFAEAIRLNVAGLPEGVTLTSDPVTPVGVNQARLTLQCAADSSIVAGVIKVSGEATINGHKVIKAAMAQASGCLCPKDPDTNKIEGTLLAMTMKAPFAIQVVDRERQHDVHRGTTFLAELDIVRDSGFAGDLRIEMSAQQDRVRMGVRGGILPVPSDQSKVFYPTFMPEWLSTDLTRRIVVHGVAIIPDPKGNLRHVSRAADARITMIMEGALLKLSAKAPETIFRPGDTIQVPVQISRSPKLPIATIISLDIPEELQSLIRCDPITLEHGTTSGTMAIRTSGSDVLNGPWDWTLRATSMQDDKWPVVSETTISVKFR